MFLHLQLIASYGFAAILSHLLRKKLMNSLCACVLGIPSYDYDAFRTMTIVTQTNQLTTKDLSAQNGKKLPCLCWFYQSSLHLQPYWATGLQNTLWAICVSTCHVCAGKPVFWTTATTTQTNPRWLPKSWRCEETSMHVFTFDAHLQIWMVEFLHVLFAFDKEQLQKANFPAA